MFLETSRGKYVGFILALGVTDLLRSLKVTRGHQRSNFKIVKTLFHNFGCATFCATFVALVAHISNVPHFVAHWGGLTVQLP